MKTSSITCVLLLLTIFGCSDPLYTPYHEVGSFNSRVEGQNQALAHILKNYGSLPDTKEYKVKYDNLNAPPADGRLKALWYNKGNETLKLEGSPPDGPTCTWKEVTKSILERAVKSSDGMLTIDSLAKSNQPTNTCLR